MWVCNEYMAMSPHQTCQWDSLSNNIFNHWFKLMIQNKLWRLDYRNERAQSLYILSVRGMPFAKHVLAKWRGRTTCVKTISENSISPFVCLYTTTARNGVFLSEFCIDTESLLVFFILQFRLHCFPFWAHNFAILNSIYPTNCQTNNSQSTLRII